ncbi:MAG TPA: hypothetical protein VE032_03435 [Actinomycetota bacterium]|nr:hypothetical protein [Actinomycetota bacterium]
MPYLIVLALAAAVGVAVYAITLRSGTHPSSVVEPGQTATAPAAPAGPPSFLADDVRPDWQLRLTGLLGLVVAVVIGGVFLAVALYVSVSTGVRLFTD